MYSSKFKRFLLLPFSLRPFRIFAVDNFLITIIILHASVCYPLGPKALGNSRDLGLEMFFVACADEKCFWYDALESSLFSSWTVVTKFSFIRPFLHELMQNVYSRIPYGKIYSHRLHIWKTYFLHELLKHDLSR